MAFCANCGSKVGDNDKFCASCGATRVPAHAAAPPPPPPPPPPPAQYQAPSQQPPPGYQQQPPPGYQPPPHQGYYQQPGMQPMGAAGASSTGLQENIASMLCYLFGWVSGIVFLLIEKKSQAVRFAAAQSIVVFGALGVLEFIFNFIPYGWAINSLLGLLTFILWVVLLVKAYQGQMYKLPVVGPIAESLAGKINI